MTSWINSGIIIIILVLLVGCDNAATEGKLINGTALPMVSLPDRDGHELSLEDFKGDVVLVDLWASWCKPCRKQHPKLVKLYQDYENVWLQDSARFVIYQVSLDQDGKAWRQAIKADKLYWPNHVSELKGWGSKVVELYDLESIPANFLIDAQGQIIGKDLRIFEIEKILQKRRLQQ